ncbi:16602_t:CDS:2 [Cetraspora pellucida]|uniref:16602_t:CDS:1 n=1 Tax=Cetraspora pellucida TaxID=1433469 RepID=A0A9N9A5B7_9GLOM|nr:16602_t:CDS:2 [Cetraspora pellucida]
MRFNAQFWTESERNQNVQQWNDHISWAYQEWDYYNFFKVIILYEFEILVLNSLEFENYISWDFAEAVHLLFSSQQEKNYLLKECEDVGKGANAVVSM